MTPTAAKILRIMQESARIGVVAEISHALRSKKVYLHSHLPHTVKLQHRTLDALFRAGYLEEIGDGRDVVYVLKSPRRNPDEKDREAARRAKMSGDLADQIQVVVDRLRRGEVTTEQLTLAAMLGNRIAQQISGIDPTLWSVVENRLNAGISSLSSTRLKLLIYRTMESTRAVRRLREHLGYDYLELADWEENPNYLIETWITGLHALVANDGHLPGAYLDQPHRRYAEASKELADYLSFFAELLIGWL